MKYYIPVCACSLYNLSTDRYPSQLATISLYAWVSIANLHYGLCTCMYMRPYSNGWAVINPRRMGEGYSSRSVCLPVTTLAATYLVFKSQVKCHRVLHGVLNRRIVWILLKTLHSKVLARFADHDCHSCFPMSSLWTEEAVRAPFQQD